MPSKAERTTQFILETVAPVFNKHGYTATSMSDITSATGLTKGAIYGNFNNKEELAIKAFEYNVEKVVTSIKNESAKSKSSHGRLLAITQFYRNYRKYVANLGGCPILNIGVDANNNNPSLLKKVNHIIEQLQNQIAAIIERGQKYGEFNPNIDAHAYAGRFFAQIQGSIFLSITMQKESYMMDMMDCIDQIIETEILKT